MGWRKKGRGGRHSYHLTRPGTQLMGLDPSSTTVCYIITCNKENLRKFNIKTFLFELCVCVCLSTFFRVNVMYFERLPLLDNIHIFSLPGGI